MACVYMYVHSICFTNAHCLNFSLLFILFSGKATKHRSEFSLLTLQVGKFIFEPHSETS